MNTPPPTNHQGVALQVRGLRKSFGNQEILKGLDFDVRPGEIFVIMGPSGSGKTVLLKHLIGLEEPDEGEILIEGQPVQSPEVMAKYRMAMVFQEPWEREPITPLRHSAWDIACTGLSSPILTRMESWTWQRDFHLEFLGT